MDPRQVIIQLRNDKKAIPTLVILVFCSSLITQEMQAWSPDTPDDYKYFIMPYVEQCNLLEYPHMQNYQAGSDGVPVYHDGKSPTRDPLKWWVNCLSYKTTGSAKFIPIFFNVGIIPLAYLIATRLTKDRIIGIIAVTALVYNPIFTRFEGSGTYDSVWSFFLLLSAYFVLRVNDRTAWSVPAFFVSLAAKTMGVLYLPAWFYMLHKSDRTKKAKWITVLCLVGGIAAAGMIGGLKFGGEIAFHPENAELAISQNIKMLWEILPVLIIAIGINRLLPSRTKVMGKGIVWSWMACGFMTTPLIYLLTNQLQFVYRFTPFLVFMSIYIGIVIVETANYMVQRKLEKVAKVS